MIQREVVMFSIISIHQNNLNKSNSYNDLDITFKSIKENNYQIID